MQKVEVAPERGNQGYAPRPGSPIPSAENGMLKVEQLTIFQNGASFEQAITSRTENQRNLSFFENKTSPMRTLAAIHGESDMIEEELSSQSSTGRDPKQRDETKSLSFHVRCGNPSQSFQAMRNAKSFRGPSFSFSSMQLSNGGNGGNRSKVFSALPRYNKIQGSFYGEETSEANSSRFRMSSFEDDEESDDDGSLQSSDGEESERNSGRSAASSEFELHTEQYDASLEALSSDNLQNAQPM